MDFNKVRKIHNEITKFKFTRQLFSTCRALGQFKNTAKGECNLFALNKGVSSFAIDMHQV